MTLTNAIMDCPAQNCEQLASELIGRVSGETLIRCHEPLAGTAPMLMLSGVTPQSGWPQYAVTHCPAALARTTICRGTAQSATRKYAKSSSFGESGSESPAIVVRYTPLPA